VKTETAYDGVIAVSTPGEKNPAFLDQPTERGSVQRWWQTKGMEVALLGVDGVGKTSVAEALWQQLPRVRVIAMGSAHFLCVSQKRAFKHLVPWPVQQLLMHGERLVRRWLGAFLAWRGWLVVYDRHPLEQFNTQPSCLKHRVNNCLFRLYGWPVDLAFWLTGAHEIVFARKQELSVERLRILDERILDVLHRCHIEHHKLNVTERSLASVVHAVLREVSLKYKFSQ